ncbi:MAG: Gfo/Idh/MocA family oxidoreductase [Verrucomicrobiota bacterium]
MTSVRRQRPLSLGVIGGALDSAIGQTHYLASRLDNRWEITAACYSNDNEINVSTAVKQGPDEERLYADWESLLIAEAGKLDAVLLLTPTPLHSKMATRALELGHAVISEKALASSLSEALSIRGTVKNHSGFLTVTYNYSGYPMVRELKEMIQSGELGTLIHFQVEMPQEGYLRVDSNGNAPKPQQWRLSDGEIPTISLDLGVHAHHLIQFLSGAVPSEVIASYQQQGHHSGIIDNIHAMIRYGSGLEAQLWYGKTSLGHSNGLRFRVYGTKSSAEWFQGNPEQLFISDNKGVTCTVTRASASVKISNQKRYERFKAGHPAGFIEAFANLYVDISQALAEHNAEQKWNNSYVADANVACEGLALFQAMTESVSTKSWESIKSLEN